MGNILRILLGEKVIRLSIEGVRMRYKLRAIVILLEPKIVLEFCLNEFWDLLGRPHLGLSLTPVVKSIHERGSLADIGVPVLEKICLHHCTLLFPQTFFNF